ncbi:hypothetical protein HFN86_08970 [Rhizobium laguerreae]|uniref:hypothetical protein n=1 Tax=Rhizobium laguerreae TaxID=1076926 RepID=UPI001C91C7D8|nr:hypothetical protein [Rhizobium laguerreae]MBY3420343.1 hypothetical protein [Rhizobium laguerreae]
MPSEQDYFPLKKVIQRVMALNRPNGLDDLRLAIEGGRIVVVAETLNIFKSKYCFEFSPMNGPLVHKSESMRELEVKAFHADKETDDTFILALKTCRHVFIEIHHYETLYESRLNLDRAIRTEILGDTLIYYKSKYKDGELRRSRYERSHELERFVAEGPRCVASDVEIVFPYADEFPSRKSAGRQRIWSPEKSNEYAAAYWMEVGGPVRRADLIRAILDAYQRDLGKWPAESTIDPHVSEFLKWPQPVQTQAFKFIENAIQGLPPGTSDRAVCAAVSKEYKKLGFVPSLGILMKQLHDFRSNSPDK